MHLFVLIVLAGKTQNNHHLVPLPGVSIYVSGYLDRCFQGKIWVFSTTVLTEDQSSIARVLFLTEFADTEQF